MAERTVPELRERLNNITPFEFPDGYVANLIEQLEQLRQEEKENEAT